MNVMVLIGYRYKEEFIVGVYSNIDLLNSVKDRTKEFYDEFRVVYKTLDDGANNRVLC